MAKYILRQRALELRSTGESVKKIAQDLGVAKSTVSMWVREVILTVEQLEKLKKASIKGAELGRFRGALKQKERRLKLIERAKIEGKGRLSNITDREFLVAGLALYWGEGSKKRTEVSFCNSDLEMVKFLVLWLQKIFAVPSTNLRFSVGINEIHRGREQIVREYWSQALNIPIDQFNETSFKKVKSEKTYQNFNDHYGTLRVRVLKSASLHYTIIGLIEGLKLNMPG